MFEYTVTLPRASRSQNLHEVIAFFICVGPPEGTTGGRSFPFYLNSPSQPPTKGSILHTLGAYLPGELPFVPQKLTVLICPLSPRELAWWPTESVKPTWFTVLLPRTCQGIKLPFSEGKTSVLCVGDIRPTETPETDMGYGYGCLPLEVCIPNLET